MKRASTLLLFVTFCLLKSDSAAQVKISAPDTVCAGSAFRAMAVAKHAKSYLWSFCSDYTPMKPTGKNLGDPGSFAIPVFSDHIVENGRHYILVVNNGPGGLVRLDFGSSLMNKPEETYLGPILPNSMQGIQIVQEGGKVLAIIVGGDPQFGVRSRIMKVDFGGSITNDRPVVTNWGNIGSLNYPVELFMFKVKSEWYGYTVNHWGNTVTRFSFGKTFNDPPAGKNLGNVGELLHPNGITPVSQNGKWHLFVMNVAGSITRLDFGNSLLNDPVGVNLGNPGDLLDRPRDMQFVDGCGKKTGYILNSGSNTLVQVEFSRITSLPVAKDLGELGRMSDPHSFSGGFRKNENFYFFAWNVSSNSFTRLEFKNHCQGQARSGRTRSMSIEYSRQGSYTVHLLTDEGLPSQESACKKITVVDPFAQKPLKHVQSNGPEVTLRSSVSNAKYLWNTGAQSDSLVVKNTGLYWVENFRYGCSVRDSFSVQILPAMDTLIVVAKPQSIQRHRRSMHAFFEDGTAAITSFFYEPVFAIRSRQSRR